MSIINSSHAIGVDTRNLVLKTRGTLHVKVGDRFYEIDFRNLAGSKDEDEEKEEYIITIDSKNEIEELEYPGDNKLIIGLDKTIFVTKNNTIIDITPTVTNTSVNDSTLASKTEINEIKSAFVTDRLYGNGGSFDFNNGSLSTKTLVVEDSIVIPDVAVKNKCCKTYKDVLVDGTEYVVKKYQNYDFIELVEVPEALIVKSGVIVKSTVSTSIPVYVSNLSCDSFTFEANGLYIIYKQKGEVIITKLN